MNKEEKEKVESQELYERMKQRLYSKEPLFGDGSPFSELLQSMVNKMLEGEADHHIDNELLMGKKNKRNGYTKKQVITQSGPIEVQTPRDRNSTFEPELIGKREKELHSGLDTQIIALYAQGNSVEDVRRLIQKIYGIEISAGKISQITDNVLPEIEAWKTRALQSFYPIVYLDAIHFKVRHEGVYSTRAFYTVYSVDWGGNRDLLGLYINQSEGAYNWGLVLQDLKKRGVEDILVICTDNLKGFSETIQEEYPRAIKQKCIVHQVRNSMKYVDDKDAKKVVVALRKIYSAPTEQAALSALELFKQQWGKTYGYIVENWEHAWEELMAYMNFGSHIRRMIYTTNPVEALHRIIRKIVKGKAAWVSETALLKQIYLALMHNEKSWKRTAYNWKTIQREIMEKYPELINKHIR
ncbi:MAG: IS256 family transposase [Saprospiraceae bacterium]|jgi:transposase-like protein|nr:IS256 family transposase [Saprospiraceae bacterium]MBK7787653.1 IS256 family transposase [Saprospiraceae bacterium]MBK8850166.1 IS256 family transposase [Saprospiraceae bacterium]MBK9687639.1 IS256 family transposase [Saprospiraceae bacterium]